MKFYKLFQFFLLISCTMILLIMGCSTQTDYVQESYSSPSQTIQNVRSLTQTPIPKSEITQTPIPTTDMLPSLTNKTPTSLKSTEKTSVEIIRIDNASEISTISTITNEEDIDIFSWSNDEEFILTFSESKIRFYEPPTFRLVDDITPPNNGLFYGWLLDEGNLLGIDINRGVSAGILNYRTGEASLFFEKPWYSVNAWEISPDGSMIFIWGKEQPDQQAVAKIIKVIDGEVIRIYPSFDDNTCSLSLDASWTLIASSVCSRDPNENVVTIWSVESGEKLYTLPEYYTNGAFTKFDPTGYTLAVFSDDFAKIWDMKIKDWIATLKTKSYGNHINFLFSSDTQLIGHYTGYDNRRLYLYDILTGEAILEIPDIDSAVFSPEGRYLAVLTSDGELRILGVRK